ENQLKSFVAGAPADVAHAEMVDQYSNAALLQYRGGERPLRVVGKDLREPSQSLQPPQQLRRLAPPQRFGLVAHGVEENANHACGSQILECSIADIRGDHRDCL